MIWEKQIMTTLQKIQAALDEITSVLANDFITGPVRESLEGIKTQLESAKTDLS
jgi:hypothetical protein|tara:strand:- start:744 stop:905 length:162 start_codon:yes stop_codon:yes gene_type:complete